MLSLCWPFICWLSCCWPSIWRCLHPVGWGSWCLLQPYTGVLADWDWLAATCVLCAGMRTLLQRPGRILSMTWDASVWSHLTSNFLFRFLSFWVWSLLSFSDPFFQFWLVLSIYDLSCQPDEDPAALVAWADAAIGDLHQATKDLTAFRDCLHRRQDGDRMAETAEDKMAETTNKVDSIDHSTWLLHVCISVKSPLYQAQGRVAASETGSKLRTALKKISRVRSSQTREDLYNGLEHQEGQHGACVLLMQCVTLHCSDASPCFDELLLLCLLLLHVAQVCWTSWFRLC